MNGSGRRWGSFLAAVILATLVGLVAYNAGVAHGLAAGPPPAGMPPPYLWHPYGWYPPFGFLLLFFGVFVLTRLLFWGPWRGRWHHGGYGRVPPAFEEWHRRSHEADRTGEPKGDR